MKRGVHSLPVQILETFFATVLSNIYYDIDMAVLAMVSRENRNNNLFSLKAIQYDIHIHLLYIDTK